MFADQDVGEAEPGHDPVEDEGTRADDVDAAGVHDRDGGPFCPGHREQVVGYAMDPRGGDPRVMDAG